MNGVSKVIPIYEYLDREARPDRRRVQDFPRRLPGAFTEPPDHEDKNSWGDLVLAALSLGLVIAGLMAGEARAQGAGDEWVSSKLHRKPGPKGIVETRVLTRGITTETVRFSVGSISYVSVPMAGQEFERVPGILAEGMGIGRWQIVRRTGDAQVYEALWPQANRAIRLYTRHRSGRTEISVAIFRTAYIDTLGLETELLQRGLFGLLPDPPGWVRRMLASAYELVTPAAHAQDSDCGTCSPGNVMCQLALATCTANALGGKVDGFKTTVDNLVSEAGTFNDTLAGLKKDLNRNWKETNKQLSRFNDELTRANDTAAKLVDFITSPAAAFVTSAAATLGSAGASLAIEGLVLAGKELIDLITGASEEREVRQRFIAAREKWEKVNQSAADLEHMIDSLLGLRDAQKQFNVTRETLIKIGPIVTQLEVKAQIARQKLTDATRRPEAYAPGCQEELATTVSSIEELVGNLKIVKKRIEEAPGAVGDKKYCDSLRAMVEKLAMAEGEIQSYRTAIIDGRAQVVWEKDWQDEEKRIRKSVTESRDKAVKVRDTRIEFLEERLTRLIATEGLKESQWVTDCEARRRGVLDGVAIPSGDLFGGPASDLPTGARINCQNQWNRSEAGQEQARRIADERKRRDDGVRAARQVYSAALKVSNDEGGLLWIQDEAHDSYMAWITTLLQEQDQVTGRYQKIKDKKAKISEVCSR